MPIRWQRNAGRLATSALIGLGLWVSAKLFGTQAETAGTNRVRADAAVITNFAGSGAAGFSGDGGLATSAALNNPFGLIRGPDGALWFADYEAHVIRRIAVDGRITTVVGTGKPGYSGDGGPAREATLKNPHEIRFDRQGRLYIADTSNNAIRRVELSSGRISTVAGTGKPGYSGDGSPAERAELQGPISIQLSPDGDLYIADIGNHVVRRVDAQTGSIHTFAGTGRAGPTPDNSPISGTPLNGPRSVDFDAAGDLWLVTREGNQVLRFDFARKVIRHMAGSGQKGFTGDAAPAKEATLSGPKGIAVAPNGYVYLADTENHAIRRIDVNRGMIETVVGTGIRGDGPVGNPRETKLSRPHGVFVDSDGAIFIGDSENHRIRVLRGVAP
ncbi:MAG TPA: hypothetical protein DCE44_21020 [Verrucomicrobiales bacterium]|nr:hypothetical protein [Verrucomicrobiales bacterium]